MTIAMGRERVEYHLSNVYDPFYQDFTRWLEEVAETGQGKMTINDESEYIDFEVAIGHLPGQCVLTAIESQLRKRVDFRAELSLRDLVSGFYVALVGFWESPDLQENIGTNGIATNSVWISARTPMMTLDLGRSGRKRLRRFWEMCLDRLCGAA